MSKLICIEGLDSSGKSTQCQLVKKYFEDNNIKYEHFHFPMYGHNKFSDIISRFLRGEFGDIDEVDPLFVATIYAMDRFKFLPELKFHLLKNDVVLLDRYVYSNIAFQCAKINDFIKSDKLKIWIKEFEFNFLKLPYPDLTLYLNIPMNIIEQRLKDRIGDNREYLQDKQDIHEANIDFQKSVSSWYTYLMLNNEKCKMIDCFKDNKLLTPDEVFNSYKNDLDNLLKK